MELFGMHFTVWQCVVLVVCSFGAGFTKTGIIGLGIVMTPLMASAFPSGMALGFMIPLYILGDVLTLLTFRRKVLWRPLLRALPWGIAGTVAAWWFTGVLLARLGEGADSVLRTVIGVLMVGVVLLGVYVSRHPDLAMGKNASESQRRRGNVRVWYGAVLGTFAGMISMLTNSGGPIWGLYLSSLGLQVGEIIGTAVWCFFVVTLVKIPLSANLGFLNADTLLLNLILCPLTVAGVITGKRVSGFFGKDMFGKLIQGLAFLGAVYLILF